MSETLLGICVGTLNTRVREHLWPRLVDGLQYCENSYASLVRQHDNDQGYKIDTYGDHRYRITDFDGIQLVTVRHHKAEPDPLPDPSW